MPEHVRALQAAPGRHHQSRDRYRDLSLEPPEAFLHLWIYFFARLDLGKTRSSRRVI